MDWYEMKYEAKFNLAAIRLKRIELEDNKGGPQ